jgi:hypothetical protein
MAISAWPTNGTSSINRPTAGTDMTGQNYSGAALGNALTQLNNSVGNGLTVNPGGIAGAQNVANQANSLWNAGLNRVNSSTPWGTTSYGVSIDPTTGLPTATSNLSLNQTLTQAQQQAQKNALGTLQAAGASPGVGNITSNVNASMGDQAIQDAVQKSYAAQMGLLQPTFGIQSETLDSQLRNQGLQPGSEAYNNAKNLLAQQQNNAYVQAVGSAEQQGIGLQNQMFGQALQNAQLGNTAATLPLNEYLALNSGSQVNAPQAPASNALPTDVTGAAQLATQGNLNQYNANTGATNSLLSGLYGVGNSLLGAGLTNANNPNGLGLFSNLWQGLFGSGG